MFESGGLQKKVKTMWDKTDPESLAAIFSVALAVIMQFLNVLVEEPQRTLKYQTVDIVVSGFYGFAVFLICTALDIHVYIAYFIAIVVGKLGVLQTTKLVEKFINKRV